MRAALLGVFFLVGCTTVYDPEGVPFPEIVSLYYPGQINWQAGSWLTQSRPKADCFTIGGPGPHDNHLLSQDDMNYLRSLFAADKIAAYRADAPRRCPDPRLTSCVLSQKAIYLGYVIGDTTPQELYSLSQVTYPFEPDEPRGEISQAALDAMLAFGRAKCQ
jgi:hypothetical protein